MFPTDMSFSQVRYQNRGLWKIPKHMAGYGLSGEAKAERAKVFLRSYIVEYTRFLSLDTQRVLADYMPRYRFWAANQSNQDVTIDELTIGVFR
jgi:hypothetical protein